MVNTGKGIDRKNLFLGSGHTNQQQWHSETKISKSEENLQKIIKTKTGSAPLTKTYRGQWSCVPPDWQPPARAGLLPPGRREVKNVTKCIIKGRDNSDSLVKKKKK